MNNIESIQGDCRMAVLEILDNQKELTEINYLRSRSKIQSKFSILFPLSYNYYTVIEIRGIGARSDLVFDSIGKMNLSTKSNISERWEVIFAKTLYYKTFSEIFCKEISIIKLYDKAGELLLPRYVSCNVHLMKQAVRSIYGHYVSNCDLFDQNDVVYVDLK